jgi:hypothetical protein
MRRILIPLTAALVFCAGYATSAGDKKEDVKKKASVWMKAKLDFSRKIQAGLIEADFNKIAENAKALNVASFLEVLFRLDRKDYKQQVQQFVYANEELIRQAEAKNLYGATLAYNQLTISCVQCHQIIRDTKK